MSEEHPDHIAAIRQKAISKILVVDEVPMFREMERLFLSRLGHVRTACSLDQALREARVHGPEVIVIDLNLSDVNDEELVPRLLDAAGPQAAIVAVTTGRREEYARAIRSGASDVLAKPLSRQGLIESVSRFIGHPGNPVGLPRVPHQCPVNIAKREAPTLGMIQNLSRGGLFIEARDTVAEGAEIRIDFELAGIERRIESTAQVMWRRIDPSQQATGMGVRFLDLDGETSKELDAFVQERVDQVMPWLSQEYRL